MSGIEIIKAFAGLEDPRRRAGQRHNLPLCLALFTLAIAAGNKGAISWRVRLVHFTVSSIGEPAVCCANTCKNTVSCH